MKRKIHRWKVGGVTVEMVPQFAVTILLDKDAIFEVYETPVERSLFYSKEAAMAAIHERLGEIVGEKKNLDAGVAALFMEAEVDLQD